MISGKSGDDPRDRIDTPDGERVHEEEVAQRVHDHTPRAVQTGFGRQSIVAARPHSAIARHCGDDPGHRINAADAVIVGIRDEEVALSIQSNGDREIQERTRSRSAVTTKARSDKAELAIACHRSNDPGHRIHTSDNAIARLSNENVALGVHGHAGRVGEAGLRGRPAIAAEGIDARAGHHGEIAGGNDLKYLVHRVSGDEKIAAGVCRHRYRGNVRGQRERAVGPAPRKHGDNALLGECICW
jgi:hypothetical protein